MTSSSGPRIGMNSGIRSIGLTSHPASSASAPRTPRERAGVGVRALIGSSWGFFAVPDVGPAAARRAGERAAAVARASTQVAGPDLRLTPESPVTGHWASECVEDPWSVSLADKGELLV